MKFINNKPKRLIKKVTSMMLLAMMISTAQGVFGYQAEYPQTSETETCEGDILSGIRG